MSVESWKTLGDRLLALGANWTACTAIGSFLLYAVGYLTLRFQLTTLGVSTDLAVLDERYLFAGARFLVYLVSALPIVILLSAVLYPVYWLVRRTLAQRINPGANGLVVAGIAFAVAAIQLVMRQCFLFMNGLPLQRELQGPGWMKAVLLDEVGGLESLFFTALVAMVAVTASFLVAARRKVGGASPGSEAILILLLGIQLLLLPVNYGVLIASKTLPRVANFGEEAWLVWEGAGQVTYLVNRNPRTLVTVPRAQLGRIEITGYDHIMRRFFAEGRNP